MPNKEELYANSALTTELLAVLAEECGEVVQAVGKCLRHGVNERYKDGTTNYHQLELELGDVLACLVLLHEHNILNDLAVSEAMEKKLLKYDKKDYFHNA